MKRAILVILSLAAAVACSTLSTSADYDPGTDFSKYKTWDWKDDGSIKNELLAKRIEAALDSEPVLIPWLGRRRLTFPFR